MSNTYRIEFCYIQQKTIKNVARGRRSFRAEYLKSGPEWDRLSILNRLSKVTQL